jgi:hypothetical protein
VRRGRVRHRVQAGRTLSIPCPASTEGQLCAFSKRGHSVCFARAVYEMIPWDGPNACDVIGGGAAC